MWSLQTEFSIVISGSVVELMENEYEMKLNAKSNLWRDKEKYPGSKLKT